MLFSSRTLAKVVFGWEHTGDRLSDTAWLTGLRGLAAFLVMMSHYSMAWLSSFSEAPFMALVLEDRALTNVWYYRKGQRLWAPWRLPILRIFMCNGGGQVAIFFVISGFVLTWSLLHLAQDGNHNKLYLQLGSATIRRWSRLYLPCAVVTSIYVMYESIKHYEGMVPLLRSIWDYLGYFEVWANPFKTVAETLFSKMQGYNLVVWTIPHEFSGSIFVYALVLATGRIQNFPRRIAVNGLVSLYALFSLKWDLWLFGTGMVLADYARHGDLFTRHSSTLVTILWSLVLLLGLLLLSFTSYEEGYTRPVYELTEHIPLPSGFREDMGGTNPKEAGSSQSWTLSQRALRFKLIIVSFLEERLWWGCGATLIVLSGCHLALVRKFFELAFLQHLGKISFMLYLIHLFIGNIIGGPIQDAAYAALCSYEHDETFGIEVCHMSSLLNLAILSGLWVVTVLPLFIVAHLLETFVDRPITTLSKKADEILLNGWSGKVRKRPERELLISPHRLGEVRTDQA